MFNPKYLKDAANPTSYQRGQQYFRQGCVGRVKQEYNLFEARVSGSRKYKTGITLAGGGADFHCSCPYNYDGICKHQVALGLAVLDQFGVAELKAAAATRPPTLPNPATLPAEVRLAFLAKLLARKPKLVKQLVAFAGLAEGPAAKAPAAKPATADDDPTTVESISTEVYETLSDLVFDDKTLRQHTDYYHEYLHDEGDAMLELADALLDEVLEPYARLVIGHLAQGRLHRALDYWLGVHEGITAATDPATDDYDLFSYAGYNGYVLEHWGELLAGGGIEQRLNAYDLQPAEAETILARLFDRYATAGYPPDEFADLLTVLTRDPAAAAQLRPRLENAPQPLTRDLVQTLLHVAEVQTDNALWVRTAEAHAGQDFGLLLRLLDHYRQHDDRPNLLRLLQDYHDRFSHRLTAYVLEHVLPTEDEALYLTALEQRCRATQSLADYGQLSGYWSAKRRREFVDEQVKLSAQRSAALFGAELLVAENREAELLAYLLDRDWLTSNSVPELLALVAPVAPEACLNAVMERTERTLLNSRGRDVYQHVTSWLRALNEFEVLRPPVALFAAYLYVEFSRLSALREELRAAKLVETRQVGNQYQLVLPAP